MKKYTLKEKLEVVELAKSRSVRAAAKEAKIDRKRIREWMGQEEDLRREDSRRFRLSGGGRKLSCSELEELLVARIEERRLERFRVTRQMIMQWAEELSEDSDCRPK